MYADLNTYGWNIEKNVAVQNNYGTNVGVKNKVYSTSSE